VSKLFHAQVDLFAVTTRTAELTGIERQKAVELLRVLLTEAVMELNSNPSASRKQETGNE
jgi:hypothetical protein